MIPHQLAHFDVIWTVATMPPISKSVDRDVEDHGDLGLGQKFGQQRQCRVAITFVQRRRLLPRPELVSVSNSNGSGCEVVPPGATIPSFSRSVIMR